MTPQRLAWGRVAIALGTVALVATALVPPATASGPTHGRFHVPDAATVDADPSVVSVAADDIYLPGTCAPPT